MTTATNESEAPEDGEAPADEPRWNAYDEQAAHAAMRDAAEAAAAMTVHERVGAIVAEMPAIGKGQKNEQQGFMYRGHDDVMNELNPLLSKYGVFFTPRVLERITDQRTTSRGGIMYEVNLHVEYTFYGPRGDSFTASAWGEGTDSGDKSTNKAMTMALKNVLAQTFAVSTEENARYDTDQHSDEPTQGRESARPKPPTTADGVALRPGAPLGWAAISATLKQLDGSMPWTDWVREALTLMTGMGKLDELTDEEKRDTGIRVANGVSYLMAALDGREMPPPSRAEVAEAFAHADAVGVVLSGPEHPLDPAEHVPGGVEPPEAPESDPPADTTEGQPDPAATQQAPAGQRRDSPGVDRDNEGGDIGLLGPMPTGGSDDIGFGEEARSE